MRGDTANGIPWLRDSADIWAPENGLACHNWWHLALLHLDRGETEDVLRIYDTKVRPSCTPIILEWTDASALLWRLRLEGVDAGTRWSELAVDWERATEHGFYAFNDLHALMAFLGAGATADVNRLMSVMRRTAACEGDNAYMTRIIGLPLAEAFIAFDARHYSEAIEKINATRGIAQRFGGSHAQRDILSLTLMHAALRGGDQRLAEALAAERVGHKPESPWAQALHRKARDLNVTQTRAVAA